MKEPIAHIAATAGVPCRYCSAKGPSCGNCVYSVLTPGLDNNFVAACDKPAAKHSRKRRRKEKKR